MGDRDMWKMLHLLYLHGKPTLTEKLLAQAGILCYTDTIQILVNAGAVHRSDDGGDYSLSTPAMKILETCVIANSRTQAGDVHVDEPQAFVIMPFSEPWSDQVLADVIEPAVADAGLTMVRGDTLVRVGDLTANVWNEILRAGIVIAEVSAPNVNVFYELGLTHALGKTALLLKQAGVVLPADFGGAHYYEYDPRSPAAGRALLQQALSQWATQFHAHGVRALPGGH
jgi:hypothetical protein